MSAKERKSLKHCLLTSRCFPSRHCLSPLKPLITKWRRQISSESERHLRSSSSFLHNSVVLLSSFLCLQDLRLFNCNLIYQEAYLQSPGPYHPASSHQSGFLHFCRLVGDQQEDHHFRWGRSYETFSLLPDPFFHIKFSFGPDFDLWSGQHFQTSQERILKKRQSVGQVDKDCMANGSSLLCSNYRDDYQ